MPWARRRAPSTACGEQQLFSPSVAGSAHSSSVTATTSSPASSASWAAAALSTPPLIATSVRRGLWRSRGLPARATAPSERCRASAVSCAACRFGGTRPPSAATTSAVPTAAASRKVPPSTSSTTALPAAISAPQPSASKPASTTLSPSTRTVTRTRSPHGEPPATPAWGASASTPLPEGRSRWSMKERTEPNLPAGAGLSADRVQHPGTRRRPVLASNAARACAPTGRTR